MWPAQREQSEEFQYRSHTRPILARATQQRTDEGEKDALRWRNPLTRNAPYKACSGFTRVTARRIAQPPKATFVTRLQPFRLPGRAARQLPDQSTILWVDS